ncbi:MAG TPA: hypothetical protein VIS71_06055 [Terrimicrobium sp.]
MNTFPAYPETGRAYFRDLPRAELHLLETGHLSLEEDAPLIATLMRSFLQGRI